ncbi:uncharacterized protein ermn [Denticeps clupeoides]|uniref:uncharacterized protein ermn n=1 Tax=Denticeps clupeoides TaxID=299321 RepID=UPI0010A3626E|nr:ermin [Denticeps clupeoides]
MLLCEELASSFWAAVVQERSSSCRQMENRSSSDPDSGGEVPWTTVMDQRDPEETVAGGHLAELDVAEEPADFGSQEPRRLISKETKTPVNSPTLPKQQRLQAEAPFPVRWQDLQKNIRVGSVPAEGVFTSGNTGQRGGLQADGEASEDSPSVEDEQGDESSGNRTPDLDASPTEGPSGDALFSTHSLSKYSTVSYRRIRKGNTRQRIDEFEAMTNT